MHTNDPNGPKLAMTGPNGANGIGTGIKIAAKMLRIFRSKDHSTKVTH
jgi:hypothetical protein